MDGNVMFKSMSSPYYDTIFFPLKKKGLNKDDRECGTMRTTRRWVWFLSSAVVGTHSWDGEYFAYVTWQDNSTRAIHSSAVVITVPFLKYLTRQSSPPHSRLNKIGMLIKFEIYFLNPAGGKNSVDIFISSQFGFSLRLSNAI